MIKFCIKKYIFVLFIFSTFNTFATHTEPNTDAPQSDVDQTISDMQTFNLHFGANPSLDSLMDFIKEGIDSDRTNKMKIVFDNAHMQSSINREQIYHFIIKKEYFPGIYQAVADGFITYGRSTEKIPLKNNKGLVFFVPISILKEKFKQIRTFS